MWVRAKEMGYYDHKRRREGAVFQLKPITRLREKDGVKKEVVIKPEQQFSERWMEKYDGPAPSEQDVRRPMFAPGMKSPGSADKKE